MTDINVNNLPQARERKQSIHKEIQLSSVTIFDEKSKPEVGTLEHAQHKEKFIMPDTQLYYF